LGEGDASVSPPDAPAVEDKGESVDETEESTNLEVKDVGKVAADAELSVEKPEGEKVASGGEDDGEFASEKEAAVSTGSTEAAEPEEKVVPSAEANGKLAGEAEAPAEAVAVVGEEAPEASVEKDDDVEDKAAKPEPESDASPVVSRHLHSSFFC
jgi:hypothetical protein